MNKRRMISKGVVRHIVFVTGRLGGGEMEVDPKSYSSETSQRVPARPSSKDKSGDMVRHFGE